MSLFFVCLSFCTTVRVIFAESPKNDYCSMCKPPENHTMCLYPSPGPGPGCRNYQSHEMTESDKALILEKHNGFRSSVAVGSVSSALGQQPKAANMMQLRWDDELQQLAARWADQCVPFDQPVQHDMCKNTERFNVGQNIAAFGAAASVAPEAAGVELERVIRAWFNEQKDYTPSWVSSFAASSGPNKVGHYTQLVWAKTQYVGCAAVSFDDEVKKKNFRISRVVCNYGPAGNVIGASVYREGEPCSKCPAKATCSSKYDGLCALEGDDLEMAATRLNEQVHNEFTPPLGLRNYDYGFEKNEVVRDDAIARPVAATPALVLMLSSSALCVF